MATSWMVQKVSSICSQLKQDQSHYCSVRELESFPHFLFALNESLVGQQTTRVNYTFTMPRREFVEKLRPLLKCSGCDEFIETFHDEKENQFMIHNCWITNVKSDSIKGTYFYSIQFTDHNNQSLDGPSSSEYTEVRLDPKERENWSSKEHELFGLLEGVDVLLFKKYEFKVHRTRFQFKENPNVMLNLDRVSFDGKHGCVVYSLFGDVSSIGFQNISDKEIVGANEQLHFEVFMKPCRSKIVQFLYEYDREGVYSSLEKDGIIPKLDYCTISLFEYEAQRIRYKWEEFNKKVVESHKKSERYISLMEKAALLGEASITYLDEEGVEHPYYSDDED